jgi:hypothetical protein
MPPLCPRPEGERIDARDSLVIERQRFVIDAEPLAPYFALTGAASPYAGTSSGSGRGYAASWELRDGRLYLVAIAGTRRGGGAGSLADLFPDFGKRVFAHWFSGTIGASQPRPTIGTVVLDGIEAAGAPPSFDVEIERGIVLAAAAAAPLPTAIVGRLQASSP